MKRINRFFAAIGRHPLIFCIVAAPLVNLFIESLGRRSILAGLSHMVLSPVIFVYNSLIIFMTLSFAMLFRRKYFFFSIILLFWMVLGIINGVVRSFRATPIAAIDFFIIKAGGGFFTSYLTWWQIVLIAAAIVSIVVLAVLLWKKDPRTKIKKISSAALILVSMLTVGSATVVGIETEMLSNDFSNLEEAYENYGFAFCFSCSLLDTGVTEPEGYSKEAVETIISSLGSDKSAETDIKPDIIMIQLESFFDPEFIRGLETSEPVIPNFRALTEAYPSGYLSVQSIGGGTANTEFEVLTGMNLDHFGPGEYPYMTILSDKSCESLPNNLRMLGYTSHAFHNYTGVFYDRHKVYANLGFNSFTSMEYMQDLDYNPRGWAKDMCLLDEITNALDSSDESQFIWAISVQPHGAYQEEEIKCEYDIKVSGVPAEEVNPTQYYLNQLKEVDDFVGALIGALESYERPVVAVLYGDHLPPLEVQQTDLDGISIHQTEYVIWSNFEIENTDRDLEAYQLSSHVLDLIGYNCGTLTRINQSYDENKNYQDDLHMIEYDMLYGENFADAVYSASELKMGIRDITVDGFFADGDTVFVTGENFTEWSVVCIDGHEKETLYIDGNTLAVEGVKLRDGYTISVVQVSDSGVVLSESNQIKKEES